eukprot:1154860-Pelagomonas_calceolata.AAC.2
MQADMQCMANAGWHAMHGKCRLACGAIVPLVCFTFKACSEFKDHRNVQAGRLAWDAIVPLLCFTFKACSEFKHHRNALAGWHAMHGKCSAPRLMLITCTPAQDAQCMCLRLQPKRTNVKLQVQQLNAPMFCNIRQGVIDVRLAPYFKGALPLCHHINKMRNCVHCPPLRLRPVALKLLTVLKLQASVACILRAWRWIWRALSWTELLEDEDPEDAYMEECAQALHSAYLLSHVCEMLSSLRCVVIVRFWNQYFCAEGLIPQASAHRKTLPARNWLP